MSIEHNSVVICGTCDLKICQKFLSQLNGSEMAEMLQERELHQPGFDVVYVYRDCLGIFEGFGIEISNVPSCESGSINLADMERKIGIAKALFNRNDLGEPQLCNFVHTW